MKEPFNNTLYKIMNQLAQKYSPEIVTEFVLTLVQDTPRTQVLGQRWTELTTTGAISSGPFAGKTHLYEIYLDCANKLMMALMEEALHDVYVACQKLGIPNDFLREHPIGIGTRVSWNTTQKQGLN